MRNIFSVCLLLASCFAWAQTPSFNLAAIPEGLKAGADVIVHSENINLEVEGLDKATVKVQKLFTVLNEKGNDALFFNEYSTKAFSLEDAEVKVYDQNGKEIEKHKKKEMTTTAVGEGLVEDGYVTYYRVTPLFYPITVEFNYEQKLKSTFWLPDYRFAHYDEAIVQSTYKAKVPSDLGLRYKANRCSLVPVISKDEKNTIYQWSVGNLPATAYEEGGPSGRARLPYVEIVSDQFSHYGYKGDFSSWKAFGSWISNLYNGLDVLSLERQQFFQQLVADAPNQNEKIRRIYQYLQQNFRYVSIQLGIGGLQPFSASFTDQKKYGDCKALSNYMKAALKAVGIKSCVAIINAGYNEEPVDKDFPANNFNHVILCVPGKDSVWLECTSSTTAFNSLGSFTENRNALLITDEGGTLVSTPRSNASSNAMTSRTTITVADDLSATSETTMEATGEPGELMTELEKETRDNQKQALVFYLGYKQPDDFAFTANAENNRQRTNVKMSIRKLPEFSAGTKYFFNPRIQKIWPGHLPQMTSRNFDYYFHYPYVKKDTTVLKFPDGFQVEALPQPKDCRTPYSHYETKYWYDANEKAVYTVTTLVLEKHKIPSFAYAEVKSFFDEVSQDDAQKIVMKRTEAAATGKKAF